MPDATEPQEPARRAGPLDLAAFLATAIASFALRWDLAELVWGLWLSSLLVGYALIVYGILSAALRPLRAISANAGAKPDFAAAVTGLPAGALPALLIGGAIFMLAFFTVHFGGFHYVHGIFLGGFFGAKVAHIDNRWLYIVVLFFYFFPFGVLRRLWQRTT